MNQSVIKPSFDSDRSILGEILPLSTPFTVILDVSEVCNFRCGYCFRGQNDKTNWGYAKHTSFMDWELFQKSVCQIQDFPDKVRKISLSNHGEPLCNRSVPDMVRYIKSQGIQSRISIHTNAAMLDEKYAKDLADSDIDQIIVSLQGLSSEKYREVCKTKVDFDYFYHNLTVLYANRKHTKIYYKIIDTVLDDGEENKFYELFSLIGDRLSIEKEVPIWKGVNPLGKPQIIYNKYGEIFSKQECCPLIFHTLLVNPVGNVYPCTQLLTPYVLGNIKNQTLLELWNSEQRYKLLIRQCEGTNPEICKDCYILQNSIYAKEDMIDDYKDEILQRLKGIK